MLDSVSELFSLDGRTAFLSGAAGHLGSSMAEALAEAGARVYLNGRTVGPLEALRDALIQRGLDAEIAPFDITEAAERQQFFAGLAERSEGLDVLVNNAYGVAPANDVEDGPAAPFARTYSVVVEAAAGLIASAKVLLAQSPGASIINVSSMYGMVSPDPRIYGDTGFNSQPDYGAAKAALIQLTRYDACHLAALGIRVNAISPGPFPSTTIASEHSDFIARLAQKVPLGRIGEPLDLKGVVIYLASNASRYVTGVNIAVDGGWTAW